MKNTEKIKVGLNFEHKSRHWGRFIFLSQAAVLCLGLGIFGSELQAVSAPVPSQMNYQGRLFLQSGGAVPDSTGNTLQFQICLDANCSVSTGWSETWNGNVVTKSGLFNVVLGSNGSPLNLPFDQDYWLEVSIYNGAAFEIMTPRQKLATAPYAFKANTARQLTLPYTANQANAANLIDVSNSGAGEAIQGTALGGGIGVIGIGLTGTAGMANTAGGVGVLADANGQAGAIGLRTVGGAVFTGGVVDFSGTTVTGLPAVSIPNPLTLTNTGTTAPIAGYNTTGGPAVVGSGSAVGVSGSASAAQGSGVYGNSSGSQSQGVLGETGQFDSAGVRGVNKAAGGEAVAIVGQSKSSDGIAVFGTTDQMPITPPIGGIGSFGLANGSKGRGVLGASLSSAAAIPAGSRRTGVYGYTDDTGGVGVHAQNTGGGLALSATTSSSAGPAILAYNDSQMALHAVNNSFGGFQTAVLAEAQGTNHAVEGRNKDTGAVGILGGEPFNSNTGVFGQAGSGGTGVKATAGGDNTAIALRATGDAIFESGSTSFTAHVDFSAATVTGLPGGVPNPLSLTGNMSFPGAVITGSNTGSGFGLKGFTTLPGSLTGPLVLGGIISSGVYGYSAASLSAGVFAENYSTNPQSAGMISIGATGVIGSSVVAGGEGISGEAMAINSIGGKFQANTPGSVGIDVSGDTFGILARANSGVAIMISKTAHWQGTNGGVPNSSTNNGSIYFDSGTKRFMVSEDGSGYVPMLGAGNGPISVTSTTSRSTIYAENTGGAASVYAKATAAFGTMGAVVGENSNVNGVGVYGRVLGAGTGTGVMGTVGGTPFPPVGQQAVLGFTAFSASVGVIGVNAPNNSTVPTYAGAGVYGFTDDAVGSGVVGEASSTLVGGGVGVVASNPNTIGNSASGGAALYISGSVKVIDGLQSEDANANILFNTVNIWNVAGGTSLAFGPAGKVRHTGLGTTLVRKVTVANPMVTMKSIVFISFVIPGLPVGGLLPSATVHVFNGGFDISLGGTGIQFNAGDGFNFMIVN